MGYGRIGAYAENSALYVDNVKLEFPNGDVPQDGMIEYKMCDLFYDASVDVSVLDDNNIIAIGTHGAYFSKNGGESFDLIGGHSADEEYVDKTYEEITATQGYVSMLKLHDGSYLYIHETDCIVKRSTDNMKTWTELGRVVPESYLKDKQGRRNLGIHNNSMTEFQLEDGTWRIFLPVAVSIYPNQLATSVCGHYTEIYYSDDGGKTWQRSKTDSRDFSTDYNRTGRTTVNTENFKFPKNWLTLHPTCHHKRPKLMDLAKRFVETTSRYPSDNWLFYVWGHTYEFDQNDNWEIIEEFAQYIGNRDDIWYATNIEIYDYVKAYESLQFSVDNSIVHNPSAIDVWFVKDTALDAETYCVKAGETLFL